MKYPFVLLIALFAMLLSGCGEGGGYYYEPPATQPPSPVPPNAPYNLTAVAISQSIVNLQWTDNSDNEEGFMIYRDDSIVGTVSANSTTYQDTSLEAGKTYQYTVKAYNVAGESGASSYTVKMPNPPLNVTINHIGVMFDHDPIGGPGDIRLLVLVSDGNPANDVEQIIPPGEGTYPLNDYETMELNQRVFHTASAGDYLKIVIIAYEDDKGSLSNLIRLALPVLGPLLGIPYAGEISAVFSQYEEQTGKPLFEDKDDYVGYFQGFWGSDESWGIGQYNAVGTEDFRVWLSIWSDSEPEPMTKPTLAFGVDFDGWYVGGSEVTTASKDDIVTARISLTGGDSGQYTIRIRRDIIWASDETIDELTFNYDGVSATKELSFSPPYATDEAGTDGYLIDLMKDGYTAWDMINAYPPRLRVSAPTVGPLLVTFDGWYVGGSEVTTASKDDTVTARISLTGGDSGQYTIRIRRDIIWASDETIDELTFSYDGVSDTIALSFTPPYATGEASTDGYHIDLVKDGYIVWTLADAYPPRLRVTIA